MSCQDIKEEQDYLKKMLNVVNAKKKLMRIIFKKKSFHSGKNKISRLENFSKQGIIINTLSHK